MKKQIKSIVSTLSHSASSHAIAPRMRRLGSTLLGLALLAPTFAGAVGLTQDQKDAFRQKVEKCFLAAAQKYAEKTLPTKAAAAPGAYHQEQFKMDALRNIEGTSNILSSPIDCWCTVLSPDGTDAFIDAFLPQLEEADEGISDASDWMDTKVGDCNNLLASSALPDLMRRASEGTLSGDDISRIDHYATSCHIYGCNDGFKNYPLYTDKYGNTLLHSAFEGGNESLVKYLTTPQCANGIVMDPLAQNNKGIEAFFYAGSDEVAEIAWTKIKQIPQPSNPVVSNLDLSRFKGAFGALSTAMVDCLFRHIPISTLSDRDKGWVALHAAKSGNLDLVKWINRIIPFHSLKGSSPTDQKGLVAEFATKSGNLDLVQWINTQIPFRSLSNYHKRTIAQYAAKSGNVELVQWINDNGIPFSSLSDHYKGAVAEFAVISGNLELVQWINTIIPFSSLSDDCKEWVALSAAESGNVELVQCINRIIPFSSLSDDHKWLVAGSAAISGNVECVEWINEKIIPFSSLSDYHKEGVAKSAAESGNVECVEWINTIIPFSSLSDDDKGYVAESAAESGNVELVQCINRIIPFSSLSDYYKWLVAGSAAISGNVECVEWINEKIIPFSSLSDDHKGLVARYAAKSGNIAMISKVMELINPS